MKKKLLYILILVPIIVLILLLNRGEPAQPFALDKESCDQLKGEWHPAPFGEDYLCNIPTVDSGKECKDATECQGSCLAEIEGDYYQTPKMPIIGRCSEMTIVRGCLYYMEDGEAVMQCRD
jgi:hypothetical protein